MYKYQFLFTNSNDEKFYKTIVKDKELTDDEVRDQLHTIFSENDNVKEATLEKVVKS